MQKIFGKLMATSCAAVITVVLSGSLASAQSTGSLSTASVTGSIEMVPGSSNPEGTGSLDRAIGGGLLGSGSLGEDAGALGPVVDFSVGDRTACAILENSQAACWGYNQSEPGKGIVGDGSFITRHRPSLVKNLGAATKISIGASAACAVKVDKTVDCWGQNSAGQLGTADRNPAATAGQGPGLSNIADIAMGHNHACALDESASLTCWGANTYGKVGSGNTSASQSPTPVDLDDVVDVGLGLHHTCALTGAGEVWCWGSNDSGQLGVDNGNQSLPQRIQALGTAVDIAVDRSHACAVLQDGSVWCWGKNEYSQLGDGGFDNSSTPVKVQGVASATSVGTGISHSCAVLESGEIRCWGLNRGGRLGNGDIRQFYSTQAVTVTGGGIATSSDGGTQTCIQYEDKTLKCSGYSNYGQLGRGSGQPSGIPVSPSSAIEFS